MQPWHRPLLASVALFVVASLSAQDTPGPVVFTQVINTTAWTGNNGVNLGAGTNPTATTVNHNVAYGTPTSVTYSAQVTGGSNNADATILLSNLSPNLLQYTDSNSYTRRVWISFSAVASSSSVWNNVKLLDGGSTNTYIAAGVGGVDAWTPGGNAGASTQYWGVGYGRESGTTPSGSNVFGDSVRLGTTNVPMTTRSYILMQIDFMGTGNTNPNADVFTIWRSESPFTTLGTNGAPTTISSLGTPLDTQSGDFNFDRISAYAGSGASLYLSDITITAEIPEPATYALALGAGMLALVGYRRYRSRKTA